jgi:hypothetical protein
MVVALSGCGVAPHDGLYDTGTGYRPRAGLTWSHPEDPNSNEVRPAAGYRWVRPGVQGDYRVVRIDAADEVQSSSSASYSSSAQESENTGMSDQDRQNLTDLAVIGGVVATGLATKTDTSPILREYARQRSGGNQPLPTPARNVYSTPAPRKTDKTEAPPPKDSAKQAEIKRRLGDL